MEMAICAGCGANIPPQTKRQDCELCRAPYTDPPLRIGPPEDGLQYTQVRAWFVCRSCGFRSPLEGLVSDMSATCCQCGAAQRMYAEWAEIYQAIRASADLAGPFGALRDENEAVARLRRAEYRVTAATRPNTRISFSEGDQKLIAVAASPGHPVCCGAPLEVSVEDGVTTTRCARCDTSRRYSVPKTATPRKHGVVGVLAPAHRLDIAHAARNDAGEVKSFACPSCGAGLPAPADARSVCCEYCGNTALLPDIRTRPDPSLSPDSRPFWLLIKGKSKKRARFEKQARAEIEQAEEWKRRAAQAAADAARRKKRVVMALVASSVFLAVGLTIAALMFTGSGR